MRCLAVLLCVVSTSSQALDETRPTLWSKLSHVGRHPQDGSLGSQLGTLALADGRTTSMRCTDDHALCLRADLAAHLEEEEEAADLAPELGLPTTVAAAIPSTGAAARRRRLLSLPTARPTPSPTVLPLPAPTAFPTPAPSATFLPTAAPSTSAPSLTFHPTPAPSLSAVPSPAPTPVPTTVAITTFAQLRNAVADPFVSEILVPDTIEFPSAIEVTRNVSIVGLSADAALRDAGTPLDRLFFVNGGALRLESLQLVNNASSMPYAGCLGSASLPYFECSGERSGARALLALALASRGALSGAASCSLSRSHPVARSPARAPRSLSRSHHVARSLSLSLVRAQAR